MEEPWGIISREELPALPMASTVDYSPEFSSLDYLKKYLHSSMIREKHIKERGYVLLTNETVQELAAFLGKRKTLDAGSGTGFLAKHLEIRGCDVTACDMRDPGFHNERHMVTYWKLDKQGQAEQLLPGDYEVVILAWPPYNELFAYRIAKAMRQGQVLVYQGEGKHGCTGENRFHDYIETRAWKKDKTTSEKLNENHKTFAGIHDYWSVYIKLISEAK